MSKKKFTIILKQGEADVNIIGVGAHQVIAVLGALYQCQKTGKGKGWKLPCGAAFFIFVLVLQSVSRDRKSYVQKTLFNYTEDVLGELLKCLWQHQAHNIWLAASNLITIFRSIIAQNRVLQHPPRDYYFGA